MRATRLVLLLLVVWMTSTKGQVVVPDRDQPTKMGKSVYGLGLAVGAATGLGLSFRHHLPNELSYQVVGGIIKVDTKLHYDVGGELQFDLVRGETTRFFAAGGLSYFYSGESGKNGLRGPFRIGLGIGGEFSQLEFLHFSVEGMFTYFSDGTILPLPQVGIHYYFF